MITSSGHLLPAHKPQGPRHEGNKGLTCTPFRRRLLCVLTRQEPPCGQAGTSLCPQGGSCLSMQQLLPPTKRYSVPPKHTPSRKRTIPSKRGYSLPPEDTPSHQRTPPSTTQRSRFTHLVRKGRVIHDAPGHLPSFACRARVVRTATKDRECNNSHAQPTALLTCDDCKGGVLHIALRLPSRCHG